MNLTNNHLKYIPNIYNSKLILLTYYLDNIFQYISKYQNIR